MKNLKKPGFMKKLWSVMLVMAVMIYSDVLFVQKLPEVTVQAAAGKEVKADESFMVDTIRYTAFGDSIAAGFGLPGYQAETVHSSMDAYREKVTEKLKIQYPDAEILSDSLAIDGLDSAQLLDYLTNPDNTGYEEFRKAAEESDVITLSIGSNDILGPFMEEVAKELGCNVEEIGAVLDSAVKSGDVRTWFRFLKSAENLNKSLAGLPEDMENEKAIELISGGAISGNTELNQACEQFADNFRKILETIHALSKSATIYVTNIYNPYKNVVLKNPMSNSCVLDLESLAEFYIKKLNQVFTPDSGMYQLIDVKTAFDFCEQVPVNVNIAGTDWGFMMENYNIDPHPNVEGHTLIASLIGEKMTENSVEGKKLLPTGKTKFTAGNFECILLSSDGINGEVTVTGAVKSVKKVVIPDVIVSENKKIPVTRVGKKAWKKDKNITSVTIGENVKTIGKQAFYQCKKLKNIKVISENIMDSGNRAWKKINKKAVFEFPKTCKKKYKKIF